MRDRPLRLLAFAFALACGAIACSGASSPMPMGDAGLSQCGDSPCGAGEYCLGACFGVPPETLQCAAERTDGPCPVGLVSGRCRGAGGQEVDGCRRVGQCVRLKAGCSTQKPGCGCFEMNPCASGSCSDNDRYGFECPPCA